MSPAEELAALLSAKGDEPIEAGATAMFEAISGGQVSASILNCPASSIPPGTRKLLRARDAERMHVRAGMLLCQGGVPVAQVTTIVVSDRIPHSARTELGITKSGSLTPSSGSTPLGRALRGLGVRRQQCEVLLTPGCTDAWGARLALRSTALLYTADGRPLARVTERIFQCFLEAFPPPWARSPALPLQHSQDHQGTR